MNSERFEHANTLWDAGRQEDAAREFCAMADEEESHDGKAALLINAHKCYCQLGNKGRAIAVMRQIREHPIEDSNVRLAVDCGDAFMSIWLGDLRKGVANLEAIVLSHGEELRGSPWYEDIQRKRAFALTNMQRCAEALPILEEVATFVDHSPEDLQSVNFYLGVCHQTLSQTEPAITHYLKTIALGLNNADEADARYRLAIIYFTRGAFAQSKLYLETTLKMPEGVLDAQLSKYVYRQLAETSRHLGQPEEERKYRLLAERA